MEKHTTFSVPIKKCNDDETIIDSFRFMSASLSDLADNSIECKSCVERKKISAECKFNGLEDNRLQMQRMQRRLGKANKRINQ